MLTLLALAVATHLPLSPSSTGSLGLADAIRLARAHSPEMSAARRRCEAARAAVTTSEAAWKPTVSLPVGYLHTQNGHFVASNGSDEYTLQADVHVPLFDPQREASYQAARALEAQARSQLALVGHTLDGTVLGDYFDTLKAQGQVAIEKAGLGMLQAELAAVGTRYKQGTSSRLDLARARLAVAQQEATYETAEAALQTARRHLATLTGDALPASLATPSAAPDLENSRLDAHGTANRPEVQAADHQIEALDQQAKAAAASRWPAFGPDLIGGWDAGGPVSAVPGQAGWSAGISLTIPLYNGGAVSSRVVEAEKAAQAARADRQALLRTLDQAVADDRQAVSTARQQLELALEGSHLAQEEVEMSRFGYQQGSVPLIEVLRAEQAATIAAGLEAAAQLTLDQARYQLAWEVGVPLP